MEESGSENLDVELEKRKETFLKVIFIHNFSLIIQKLNESSI